MWSALVGVSPEEVTSGGATSALPHIVGGDVLGASEHFAQVITSVVLLVLVLFHVLELRMLSV